MKRISGQYIRVSGYDSAEVEVRSTYRVVNGFHVSGLAMWGTDRQFGPHTGELSFSANLHGKTITYEMKSDLDGDNYKIVLHFLENHLEIIESNFHLKHGMNVTFNGVYKKAKILRPLLLFRGIFRRFYPL